MRQRILNLLTHRRSDLKREWKTRLRAAPIRSALGDPAILSYLMDETLEEFSNLLRRRKVRRIRIDPRAFEKRCSCGLNPLLAYYVTGAQALALLLDEEYPTDEVLRAFISGQWHLFAQRELDALCGACIRKCQRPFPNIATAVPATTPSRCADAGDLYMQSELRPPPDEKLD